MYFNITHKITNNKPLLDEDFVISRIIKVKASIKFRISQKPNSITVLLYIAFSLTLSTNKTTLA
jgi:hypothetical protein